MGGSFPPIYVLQTIFVTLLQNNCMRLYLLLPLLLCAASTQAQVHTYIPDLKDTSANTLFLNYSNTVVFANLPDGAQVKFNGDGVNPISYPVEKAYDLRVSKAGSYSVRVLDKGKEIYKRDFVAKKGLGEPIPHFGIIKGWNTTATVDEVLAQPAIICDIADNPTVHHVRLFCYDITLIRDGDAETIHKHTRNEYHSTDDLTGRSFDNETQAKIKLMKKGDKIIIEGMQLSDFTGQRRTLDGHLNITIK